MRIGILGTGHLARFVVEGAAGSGYSFLLSPRNAETAAELVAGFGCELAASNQDVVDCCRHVLVALPAATGPEVLAGLTFSPEHQVLSVMAGVSAARLAQVIGPAQGAVAMMPGHANAYGLGPSVLHPGGADWVEFLSVLGPVHVLEEAAQYEVAAVFGALSGASFPFISGLVDWFAARGLPEATARALVAGMFRGNAEVILQGDQPLARIAAGVATPGGITEMLVGHLRAAGALSAWDAGMEAVLARMTGR